RCRRLARGVPRGERRRHGEVRTVDVGVRGALTDQAVRHGVVPGHGAHGRLEGVRGAVAEQVDHAVGAGGDGSGGERQGCGGVGQHERA
ncbi:hypothetical protein COM81_26535, partial [Priestia megaterium]